MELTGKLVWVLLKELRHGWVSAVLIVLIVAAVTGTLTFLHTSGDGLQREISRNVRDLGSNVVILPSDADQMDYHLQGGFSDATMPLSIVDQLLDHRASLNHLIPMLELRADVSIDDRTLPTRIVGIAASIPMPGRPKAPMQRAITRDEVQLGSQPADQLQISRQEKATVKINGQRFLVQRVNGATGTWQDSAVFMDLEQTQSLFDLPNRISRIEAVECTSEKCAVTGESPHVVLQSELAEITDQAILLRREAIAEGRRGVRGLTRNTLQLVNTSLWIMLVCAVSALAGLNTYWRRAEIGLLGAIGYGPWRLLGLFVSRASFLSLLGACLGALAGAGLAYLYVPSLLEKTGASFGVSLSATIQIILYAVGLATLAACLPGWWAVSQQPADILGENG